MPPLAWMVHEAGATGRAERESNDIRKIHDEFRRPVRGLDRVWWGGPAVEFQAYGLKFHWPAIIQLTSYGSNYGS